ncbi:hypothetical protein [Streptomyces chromofuscus]|uniref:hypothetical protein n=1 Tax=Streptomyces chromofuscus TaxID=42881 RepID=UPI00199C9AE1|nr:hypothetical protein [Streptomyces chromofuscus]GGS98993.1 hypothetical protein GCM10010254_18780 [Streptomyces chromofuscus]
MERQKTSPELPAPLRAPVTALRKVPGAGMVTKAAGGALDAVGAVSPRGRRVAVYTGAGILGVAGVVEWPVALTMAGVAWLTQPKPRHEGNGAATTTTTTPGGAEATAVKSPTTRRTATSSGKSAPASRRTTSTSRRTTSGAGKSTAAGARSASSSGRRKATTSGA